MTDYLRVDQYTYVDHRCPMRTDVHPADDFVEVVLGECRFGGDTVRLVVDDPDTLIRLAETFGEARMKLIRPLHAKAHPDSAMSQVDSSLLGPIGR